MALSLLPGPMHRLGLPGPTCASATVQFHAAIVVQHSKAAGGAVLRTCVAFTGQTPTYEAGADPSGTLPHSITLAEALSLSGIQYQAVEYSTYGEAICQVDHEPATPPEGFNQQNCLNTGGSSWGIWNETQGGGWTSSRQGASSLRLSDGDGGGFTYGGGPSQPPPSPAGVCPPRQADAAPSPAPTQPRHLAPSSAPTTAPSPTPTRSAADETPAASPAVSASPSPPETPGPDTTPTPVSPRLTPPPAPRSGPGDAPGLSGALVGGATALLMLGLLAFQLLRRA